MYFQIYLGSSDLFYASFFGMEPSYGVSFSYFNKF